MPDDREQRQHDEQDERNDERDAPLRLCIVGFHQVVPWLQQLIVVETTRAAHAVQPARTLRPA